jgi:hypothetical protein
MRSSADPYTVFVWADEDPDKVEGEYSFSFTEEEEWQAVEVLYIIGQIRRDIKNNNCPLDLAIYLGSLITANRLTYRDLPPYFPRRTPSKKSRLKNLELDESNKNRDSRMADAVRRLVSEDPELNRPRKISEIARRLSEDPEFKGLSARRYQELVTKFLREMKEDK